MANAACDGGFITTASVDACTAVKDIISRLASREGEEEETDAPTTTDPETVAPTEETEIPVEEETSSSTRATIDTTETVDVTDPTEADEGEDSETTAPSTGFFEGRDAKWIAMFTSGCVAALVGITLFAVVSMPS